MMNDTSDKKPARRPLTLNKGGARPARGRSSAVVVEKKKKILVRPGTKQAGAAKATPKIKPNIAPINKGQENASTGETKPVVPNIARPAPIPRVSSNKVEVPETPVPKAEPAPKVEAKTETKAPEKPKAVEAAPKPKAPAPKLKPALAPPPPKPIDVKEAARALGLSVAEYKKRQEALQKAQAEQAERQARRRAEEAERQQRMKDEREALERKKREEEEAELRRLEKEEEERQKKEAEARNARKPVGSPLNRNETSSEDMTELEKAGGRVKKKRGNMPPPTRSKGEQKRRRGKLTIVSALSGDDERQRSLASMKRAREREKQRQRGGNASREKVQREVTIPEVISVGDLANRMAERGADVVKYLMQQGQMMNINDMLDADTAQLIVEDFGHTVKRVAASDVEENFIIDDTPSDEKDRKPRAPVIAVMGHVDHGKTSLLDALRSTDVASGEAGGITQHIGAYQLKLKSGETITVLDTPGHAAFSEMRTRGAEAVDIVVLVVAADDGIMPQTIESIKYAQAADKPIIVAINKMDAYEANPQKVETDLLQHSVITESMSGETQAVQVSALKKTGLAELAEAITLQAELMDLKANPTRNADGLVIESKIEKGRGPVSTLLVKRGTLKRGQIVVAGEYWGKVKALTDERNKTLKQAGPSVPVEVMGLDGAPQPGEPFAVVENESRARELTNYRKQIAKDKLSVAPSAIASMEQMMAKLNNKETSEMPLLVKADVQGSAEAIKTALENAGNEEVMARVVYSAAGGISESDVQLAATSGAPIIAFNVRANRQAKDLAEREGVEIRYYSVIYDLIEEIKGALSGMLEPERRETFIGYAEILEVFNITKLGKVAGCKVTEGRVERGSGVRLLRDDVVIHEGELSTLKRFKDEVPKVQAGMECGMGFEGYHDLRKGDQIECFTVELIERNLD
ncbi:translation initiation factor 2 (bIF-2) [Litorimonas taeanensis]|uniref:Translation initiation factor IF-2 n=1 Tax=Litorimonas taeanensis TaxID=568099 RepID=A0A420WET2_9PROT|nr:translation initiation factor IF-2 [Litorimonas taeanensis]RKQ69488.1 translation initiation factor 2 (bIF-2) [Litorimonas taeanensis]